MIEGNLVDTIKGDIYPATISFFKGKLASVKKTPISMDQYIIPGLIDSHIHVESSFLCPSRFAEAAVPHGTTAVITDPHEIANVMGMEGIKYMVEDGRNVPLNFYFTAPSSVPSTPWETSGATIGWKEVKHLLESEGFVALGEVMNWRGVIEEDPDVVGKIEVADQVGVPIDGHAPGLSGEDLNKYIYAGITTDHECTTLEEAEEKHEKGMTIMVREGTASKNMEELIPFVKENECFLVTDDIDADDLRKGHMDALLRKAVEYGVDPVHAIQACTIWPSRHYRLPGGAVEVGRASDFVVVDDLESFNVREVYIDGQLVAKDGEALFIPEPIQISTSIAEQELTPSDLEMEHPGPEARVRVIRVLPDQIINRWEEGTLSVKNGVIRPDTLVDIIRIAVVNRYCPSVPALGFVRGFNLKRGAIASTVAHDSHNIIIVGVDPISMKKAFQEVSRNGGLYATDGNRGAKLELPIAGLMTDETAGRVAAKKKEVFSFARYLGCDLPAPFMTLAFQSLLVLPELKLGDRGLFDSERMGFVDPVIE